MNCPVIQILTELRDRLRNLDTMEIQREKARLRMRAKRAAQSNVREPNFVREQKEDEKRKETFPPAPPIEKSEKKKKGAGEGEDARAREVSSDVLRAKRKRDARVAKVAAYNAELGGDIDADYFVDYYADHWPRDWRARFRNWLKEDKRTGRIVAGECAVRRTAPVVKIDWSLCAERCANCRDNSCACGIAIPPACEKHPRPPEECGRFTPS